MSTLAHDPWIDYQAPDEPFEMKPRRKKKISEKDVEKSHVDAVKADGGASYKFVSPAHRAVPDRIDFRGAEKMLPMLQSLGITPQVVRLSGFKTYRELAESLLAQAIQLTELKRPGKDATEEQKREHARLRALGFKVNVIDQKQEKTS